MQTQRRKPANLKCLISVLVLESQNQRDLSGVVTHPLNDLQFVLLFQDIAVYWSGIKSAIFEYSRSQARPAVSGAGEDLHATWQCGWCYGSPAWVEHSMFPISCSIQLEIWQNHLGRCMHEMMLWEARKDHDMHQRESEFWSPNWGQEEQIQERQILGDRRKRKEDPCLALSPLLGWKMLPFAQSLFPRDASETLQGSQDLPGEMPALYYHLFGQNLFPAALRNLDNHRSTLSSTTMEADWSAHRFNSYHCYRKVSWQRLCSKSASITELHNHLFSYIYTYMTSKFLTCSYGLSLFSSTLMVWKISTTWSWAPQKWQKYPTILPGRCTTKHSFSIYQIRFSFF